jgi:[protein-PII] uridylyltransferase
LKKSPLSVFERQKHSGKKLDRALRRRLGVILRDHLKGVGVRNAMRREFVDLIRDDHNIALVVRSLHDTQFLMRIIPEYGQLTCLKRYDLYHHYTVDEHSFKVLEHIADLGGDDVDTSDRFVRLYSEIPDKRALFLAALLHDVGKIQGRGHAKKGAVMAKKILARMFLPKETIDLVSFLIEQHLVMSHYSQRRDTSDLGTISSFCDTIKNREHLKYLCLLTYADYKATSPDVWNEWKGTLLWELYLRGYAFMMKQEKQPEAVYKQHKTQLLDAFSERDRDVVLQHLDLLPGGYLLSMSAEEVREHMDMIDELKTREFALSLSPRKGRAAVTFCTEDKPYRLSELCGAMALADMNILHAFAFTRSDGKVIDVFEVEDMAGMATPNDIAEREVDLGENLSAILSGERDPALAAAGSTQRWRRVKGRDDMPVAVKINFENDVSVDATIIDIFAPDQPGLLYKITRSLSSLGLGILRARISTEGPRAIDSFYVCNGDGMKISSASALQSIREVLVAAIT